MNRHAKAASAGSTSGRGKSLPPGSSFALRGTSSDAKGSGAVSGRFLLALLATLALSLALGAGIASAAGYVPGTPASFCSGPGEAAGECGELKGIAMDPSNGHVYVVDAGNLRVNEFDANGTFVRAFGSGVATGVAGAEVCTATCVKGQTTGTGALPNAKGIAVDPKTHVVYLVSAPARVAYYNGTDADGIDGAFLGQTEGNVGINAGAPEKFSNSTGIAVDSSDPLQHYLYVAIRPGLGKIDKFKISAAGVTEASYVCQITGTELATSVNSTECGGNGFIAHKNGIFEGFDTGVGGFSPPGGNLGVDAAGNVFLAEKIGTEISGQSDRHYISEFDKTGNFVTQFKPCCGAPTLSVNEPRPEAIAALPSGNLLITAGGPGASRVQEYNPASPSIPLMEFGLGSIGTGAGVATDGINVYVADRTNKKIWKYVPTPEAPTISTEAATALTKTTATLNGTVDPNFADISDCHFEYGISPGPYTHTASCVPSPGSGADPVAVSAAISGLTLSTDYHFRLVATNSVATVNGDDLEFTTTALNKPTVETTAGATEVTQNAARVSGTVNPNGLEVTDCKVEYGTSDSYGSEVDCASIPPDCSAEPGSGTSPVGVCFTLGGLSAKTTYHFRFVATNEDGTATGADQTFRTLGAPTVTTTAGATEITQTTAKVAGTVNPNLSNVTDCRIEYGTTTSYGSQKPCVPAPGAGSSPVAVTASLTGLTPAKLYHFRVVATNAIGTTTGVDQTFETLPNAPTVVTTAGATELAPSSAKVAGTVNPNSGNVSDCRFEYGPTTTYGSQKPCAALPGSGSGAIGVDATLTGLSAESVYHFRLVATNVGGTTFGADRTFTTFGPPRIAEQSALVLGTTETTLRGHINPMGFATSYRFEYGTDASYGSQVPVDFDAFIGSGAAAVKVSGKLTGLQEDTTYHYRIVATSGAGTANGPDQTFTTARSNASCANGAIRTEQTSDTNPSGTAYLPNCMALELVTPPKKYNQGSNQPGFSASGDAIRFNSTAALAGTPNLQFIENYYVSKRTDSGWIAHATAPPVSVSSTERPCNYSPGLSHWTVPGNFPEEQNNLKLSPTRGGIDGNFEVLSPPLAPTNAAPVLTRLCEGSSSDASRFFFGAQTSAYLPGDPVSVGGAFNVYEAHLKDGIPTLELLTRDKDGVVWGGNCGASVGLGSGTYRARRGAISPDASRVYFTSYPAQPPGGCNTSSVKRRVMLRLRTPDGPEISTISVSECTRVSPPCDSTDGDDKFAGASQEGSRVFFTTARQLANSDLDTTDDLYSYDSTLPVGSRMTQVSVGDAGNPTPGKGAEVLGVSDISGDGSRAYFVAKGVLTTTPNLQGTGAAPGKPNLYLFERDAAHPSGRTVFIATLESSDGATWAVAPGQNDASAVPLLGEDVEDQGVGGDGHTLLFVSKAPLTPDDGDGARSDLYRYEANTGALQRISAAAAGGGDNGAFDVSQLSIASTPQPQNLYFGRKVSEDGRTIVFSTAEALDPADTDGKVTAYLWRDGALRVLAGAFSEPSVSTSGDAVAFVSSLSLLGIDGDGSTDIYTARVGGGFTTPVVTPCSGEACQEPFRSQPQAQGAASESFAGQGNIKAAPVKAPKCPKGKQKVKRKGKTRCVKPRHANANRRAGK